jgi:hypothetical protein
MKTRYLNVVAALIIAAGFYGCGVSDEDILKKYESYAAVDTAANRAGIGLALTADSILRMEVSYADARLHLHKGNVELLSGRLFAVNAENPAERLDVAAVTEETASDSTVAVTYRTTLSPASVESAVRYALVCFKGISASEFAGAATPPCFFIVSLDKENPHVLTDTPLSAGELFAADYEPGKFIRFIEPQVYSGTIGFAKSKNVTLSITVSADALQATDFKLTAGELYMMPKNRGSGMASIQFTGGVENTAPIEIRDGKLSMGLPLIADLTVTDACIYGTVKVEILDGVTSPVYAVLRNTTTPQEIPQEILKE